MSNQPFSTKPNTVHVHPYIPTPPPPVTMPPNPPLNAFDFAVRFVLENEDGVRWDHDNGTFTDDPRDPGGATKWGVIKTEFETYFGHTLTLDEVKAMPRETAISVYRRFFWNMINGDSYKSKCAATAIFDTAVNKGLGGCMVVLTDALHNHFPVRYGPDLVLAVNAFADKEFIEIFEPAAERYISARIAKFPNMEWARKGWTNRAKRLFTLVGA